MKEADQDDDSPLICFCHFVRERKIREAIAAGADTLEAIQAQTLASTGCTGCEERVLAILNEMLAKRR